MRRVETVERLKRRDERDYFDAPWASNLFRPVLIALVATCVVAGPLAILRAMTSWRMAYVLPLAFAVALEAVYSTSQLGRPRWRDRRGMAFRLGEVMCFLVVLRVAIWVFSAGLPGLDDFSLWLRHPGAFFEGEFVVLGMLLVLAWGLAVGITGDFLELALQPDEIAAREIIGYGESASHARASPGASRSEVVGRFAARWAVGGGVLVFFAAVSRVTFASDESSPLRIGIAHTGLPADILAALVCYFLAGLLLMSQGRLAVLRGRWYNQEVDVRPTVLRRWYTNSLLILLVVAVLAALLPIGSTGWLSQVLGTILAFLLRAAYFVMFLIALLLTALLYPFRNLFRSTGAEQSFEPPPMQVPTQEEAVRRLPDWLGGSLVWIVVALIVGYLLVNYLAAHGVFKGRLGDLLLRLRFWWSARWARLSAAAGSAARELRSRLRPPARAGMGGLRLHFVRVSKLPPRERVRYFYLKMVGHAADHGLTRPPHATPLEFARDLDVQWPEAEADVGELTEAFLKARYADHAIEVTEARTVQEVWRRVMRALRGKVESGPGEE